MPSVRLSQCMIVKNEEKNIEQALLWAKGIAFEQIVVDTGSTDRTIEIAERMGAKVLHFEWINDFAAAKNFAIEHATGNWIALLDADEYFPPEDAKRLMLFLKQFQNDRSTRETVLALGCELVNVDDNGNPTTSSHQLRIFRNLPFLRYEGKVHERLTVDVDKTTILDGVKFIHTGYTASAMEEKNKTERNENLLRLELERNPNDLNIKAYLADVLRLKPDNESVAEAERYFTDVINSGIGADVHDKLKHKAFIYFANKYSQIAATAAQGEGVCRRALLEFPGNLDFEYFLAVALKNLGRQDEALEVLKKCEAKLSDATAINESIYISVNPSWIHSQINEVAKCDKRTVPLSHPSRLSLCMIAKNEERNITTALASVRDIASQMIVVDTGSTDKTAQIAQKLGADVHHFNWINDFSAARNYSIEKATGEWIIYLDADEYFTPENAQKLASCINEIQDDEKLQKSTQAISMMIVNLDDNQKPMTKFSAVRVFKNIPSIRFKGKIHEQPSIDSSKILNADDIEIMHTGYSESAHKETGKGQRNTLLLREELKNDPDNINNKAYLANSLSMSKNEKDQAEAVSLITEILCSNNANKVHSVLKVKMYIFMINRYISELADYNKSEEMCLDALNVFPHSVDFEYLLATVKAKKGDYQSAWELLRSCEESLVSGKNLEDSIMITADPTTLFSKMILTAKELGDIESVILYSTHVLSMDKTRSSVLGPCIATLVYYGVSNTEIKELLSNIYDFNNPEDTRFVKDTASKSNATTFAESLL